MQNKNKNMNANYPSSVILFYKRNEIFFIFILFYLFTKVCKIKSKKHECKECKLCYFILQKK